MIYLFFSALAFEDLMSSPHAVSALSSVSLESHYDIRSKFDELLKEVLSDHFYSTSLMSKLLSKYDEYDLRLIFQDLRHL